MAGGEDAVLDHALVRRVFDHSEVGHQGGVERCPCVATNRPYLTQCIYQLVLESQLPHKIVNLLFTITD